MSSLFRLKPLLFFCFCLLLCAFTPSSNAMAKSVPARTETTGVFPAQEKKAKTRRELRKEKRQKRREIRRSLRAKNWSFGKVIALWIGAGAVGAGLGYVALVGFSVPIWGLVGVVAAGIIFLLLLALVVMEGEESFWRSMLWAITAILFGGGFLAIFSPETLDALLFVLELL